MKLSEVGYASVSIGEPVRWKNRNGKLATTRSEMSAPFVITWTNGETSTFEANDPALAQIKYCPDMNPGQEFVITVNSKFKTTAERLTMLSLHLAQLGKNETLRESFEDSFTYLRNEKNL